MTQQQDPKEINPQTDNGITFSFETLYTDREHKFFLFMLGRFLVFIVSATLLQLNHWIPSLLGGLAIAYVYAIACQNNWYHKYRLLEDRKTIRDLTVALAQTEERYKSTVGLVMGFIEKQENILRNAKGDMRDEL